MNNDPIQSIIKSTLNILKNPATQDALVTKGSKKVASELMKKMSNIVGFSYLQPPAGEEKEWTTNITGVSGLKSFLKLEYTSKFIMY